MTAALTGFGTGLALIVAIGAQNAYLLRQGILRQHVAVVASICIAADVLLIAVGTAGVGAIVQRHPVVLQVATWTGAAFLVWLAISAFRRVGTTGGLSIDGATVAKGSVVATTLALTFLNPHVYLDTVLMLGGIASTFGEHRWAFAAGAMVASLSWFSALAVGARALAGTLARPTTWRYVDIGIGVIMLACAVRLVWPS